MNSTSYVIIINTKTKNSFVLFPLHDFYTPTYLLLDFTSDMATQVNIYIIIILLQVFVRGIKYVVTIVDCSIIDVYNIIDKYIQVPHTVTPMPNRPKTADPADNCRVIRFDEVCARASPGHSCSATAPSRDRRSSARLGPPTVVVVGRVQV